MRLYISGPMTGYPEHNYPAFNAVAKQLRDNGHIVYNPAENHAGATHLPRPEYMRLDLQHVLMSDGLVLLDGWQYSPGARAEVLVAQEAGLKFYRPLPISLMQTQVAPIATSVG